MGNLVILLAHIIMQNILTLAFNNGNSGEDYKCTEIRFYDAFCVRVPCTCLNINCDLMSYSNILLMMWGSFK